MDCGTRIDLLCGNRMTTFREERSELVLLLASLHEQKLASHKPEMFLSAIKQTRRKLLGLYRQCLNARVIPPADILPAQDVVLLEPEHIDMEVSNETQS